ncbi:SEFIR domain-containing protein [Umezawaea endophytica]|uniref:TIR domain-containing protein n=1 Tax=Umezawaea endophytica TaxID=1654476 RepID=A0A9X3AHC3_9PSEU|nr:SEFIR domain-containing protein [Umezawaea endophytica]MCS7479235.1 TIR domain-containing protein [Umezawaea endophytica]
MSDREAPRVFITYSHDTLAHKEQVRAFATFLRVEVGLDVHLDQWYDSRRLDWSAWAIDHLTNADFILVIASPEYKRRADGAAPPDEGRGAQFESAIIRDNLTKNLRGETARVLPVVLPGRSVDEIPVFLHAHSTTRYEIEEFTVAGVTPLLAAITGHGQYPLPERGEFIGSPHHAVGPQRRAVLLASLPWLGRSADLRHGSAKIDDRHYGDSVVLRPSLFASDAKGFVEFDLGRRYRRLSSVVGVLDDATEAKQVGYFRVFVDGSPEPEVGAALGRPGLVDVDVTGVLRVRLEMYRADVVRSSLMAGVLAAGGRSANLPELAWGNPTLTPVS